MSVRPVQGTTDTLQPGDNNNIVAYFSNSAVTVTVPPGLPKTSRITLLQTGSGVVTCVAATGVALDSFGGGASASTGQWSSLELTAFQQDNFVVTVEQTVPPTAGEWQAGTVTALNGLSINSGTLAFAIGPTIHAVPNTAPLIITDNAAASPLLGATHLVDMVGPDGADNIVGVDAFGGIPVFRLGRADGTAAAPTTIQNGDVVGIYDARGWTGAAVGSANGVVVTAIENFTTLANGTKLVLRVGTKGALTNSNVLTLTGDTTVKQAAVAGGLTVAGGLVTTTGQTSLVANIGTTTAMIVNGNSVASPALTPSHLIDIVGPPGQAFVVGFDAFGTNVDAVFRQTAARGTAASPTASQSGDFLGEWDVRGMMDNAVYSRGSGLNVQAIENFTSTATGTKIQLSVIGQGSTAVVSPLTVSGTTSGKRVQVTGGLSIDQAGTFVANGTTAVTVTATGVTAASAIIISKRASGGTPGAVPQVGTITAGTNFTVSGTALDTSTYNYSIVN